MALMMNRENPMRLDPDGPNRVPVVLSSQVQDAHCQDQELFRHIKPISIKPPKWGKLVSLTDQESAGAEAFRLISVRLYDMRHDRHLKSLLITSTIPQEGKSMVSANLACTLAKGGHEKVLLIEGDVRRPTLAQKLGMESRAGLCELLRKEVSLFQSIVHLPDAKMWVLPSGQVDGNPLELLQSQKLSPLMTQLVGYFDWIIIDSPPVLPVADASVWSAFADGILLVTRYGITQKKELIRGVNQIDKRKLVGAVLNYSKNRCYFDYYYQRGRLSPIKWTKP